VHAKYSQGKKDVVLVVGLQGMIYWLNKVNI
jgi:hypothetical protein